MTSAISREHEEYIDFQKYWLVLKRRWVPATATFVTVVTLTLLAALSRKPVYEAEAQILIKSDRSSKLTGLNNQMGEIQVLTNQSDPISTEAKILSSRPIIEKAIKQLDLRNDEGELLRYQDVVGNLKERETELETLLRSQIKQTRENEQIGSLENLKILNIGESRYDQSLINEYTHLGVQHSGVSSKLAEFKNTLADRKQRLETLPSLEEKQRELERRVAAAQATYQTLLSKLQETQVAENQNVGNIRVTAEAVVPEDPSGISKKLIVAAGGVVGALLGVAVAFLLDLQDRSIKNSKEAEKILGYPLQAVIPDWGKKAGSLITDRQDNVAQLAASNTALVPVKESYPTLQAREAYQMLQTNLKFLSADWEKKVIAIASSVPREGKSAVVANLAASLARVKRRVLLIDADMRRPTQHRIWEIANTSGLSNVLMDEAEWQEAIQKVMPGLDVLSAGTIPDNPVPLLESEQMKTLIETISKSYDWVLLDAPPLVGMADTTIVGRMVDGLLMVVRPGVADYGSAIAAKKLLISNGQNVLGIVANGVNLKNEPYGSSYFYALEEK
ncbi:polysaccharide biosynthesis tyrosine autokinase [Pleurocapsales cyanobacterium LEGE 06147]|nr:polysaccharide biosynthesis tyrosine autokinase [Pleurocapsales cyanobacterium LEGE 06147]